MNEAFWAFYLIGLVSKLGMLLNIAAVVMTIGTVAASIICICVWSEVYREEEKAEVKKFSRRIIYRLVPITILVWVLYSTIPTQTAMYAWVGQEVAETTELDDTMLNLKELVDAKIEELKEKEKETEQE